jgi:anaerobic dimethyl sulfoxide reductase subunit A
MYIPLIEGRHADESAIPHPDVLGLRSQGYKLMLATWHIQYRSHSTLNNNAFMNERFKKDAQGKPAFLNPRTRTSREVWDDGVYEECWINPATAGNAGIAEGDRVLISSARGKIYASAHITQRVSPLSVYIGQGSWRKMEDGVDVGGCGNTLTAARPTRICQGMTLAGGTLVKIQKA